MNTKIDIKSLAQFVRRLKRSNETTERTEVMKQRANEFRREQLLILLLVTSPIAASAASLSNPTPTVSHSGSTIVVKMDLTGFPAYGIDGAADILADNDPGGPWHIGTWNFNLGALGVDLSGYSARLTAQVSLDDHYLVPVDHYGLWVDNPTHSSIQSPASAFGVQHGSPAGGPFENWTTLTTASFTPPNDLMWRFGFINGDPGLTNWVAVDAIEVTLTPFVVPEPSSLVLTLFGGIVAFTTYRRRMKEIT